jgi:hypothetical protein
MSEPARKQRDHRSKWDESPELRIQVQEELRNWAIWSHGGKPDLGHAHKANFYDQMKGASPSGCPPVCDVEKAKTTEDNFVMWRLVAKEAEPYARHYLAKLLLVLRLHYMTSKAAHTKARIANVSRKQYYRLLEDAEYRYWVISL